MTLSQDLMNWHDIQSKLDELCGGKIEFQIAAKLKIDIGSLNMDN